MYGDFNKFNITAPADTDSHPPVWLASCSYLERAIALLLSCLPERGLIFCNPETVQFVNPGTLYDRGALRAQHSSRQGRLLFFQVMSILLGISASLHTTYCAQQCGEARASRVVVSACQSQSQGSVSSHQSEKLYPDVACLPPHRVPSLEGIFLC